jgi:hypothetical protein
MADKMGISQEELFKLLLKKLGGLKENSKKDEMNEGNDKSFEDVFKNLLDTDDATEIKAYVKEKGPAVLRLIRSKLNSLHGQARKKVADYLKVELDEAQWDYGTQVGTGKEDREEDTFEKIVARSNSFEDFEKEIQNQLSGRTNDIEGLRRVYNKYKGTKLGEARSQKEINTKKPGHESKKVLNKESSIKEKLRPAIQKLVQEVLDEMGQK